MTTTRKILAAIDCQHLALSRGEGYWYFIFDNGQAFETCSIMVPHLNRLSLEAWISAGRAFVTSVDKAK